MHSDYKRFMVCYHRKRMHVKEINKTHAYKSHLRGKVYSVIAYYTLYNKAIKKKLDGIKISGLTLNIETTQSVRSLFWFWFFYFSCSNLTLSLPQRVTHLKSYNMRFFFYFFFFFQTLSLSSNDMCHGYAIR